MSQRMAIGPTWVISRTIGWVAILCRHSFSSQDEPSWRWWSSDFSSNRQVVSSIVRVRLGTLSTTDWIYRAHTHKPLTPAAYKLRHCSFTSISTGLIQGHSNPTAQYTRDKVTCIAHTKDLQRRYSQSQQHINTSLSTTNKDNIGPLDFASCKITLTSKSNVLVSSGSNAKRESALRHFESLKLSIWPILWFISVSWPDSGGHKEKGDHTTANTENPD